MRDAKRQRARRAAFAATAIAIRGVAHADLLLMGAIVALGLQILT